MFSVMSVSLSVYLSTGGPHVTTYGPARGSERVHLELPPTTHTHWPWPPLSTWAPPGPSAPDQFKLVHYVHLFTMHWAVGVRLKRLLVVETVFSSFLHFGHKYIKRV